MASAQDAEIFRLPEEIPALYWLQLWQTAQRNWKTLVLFTGCGAALGVLIASFQTPLYHAVASIEVQGITDNFLKSQDGNPNAGADAELMDLQTQIRIMQSGSVVDGVVRKLSAPAGANDRTALRQASQSLNVHVAGQTRIIEIASDSSKPQVAADFVNGVADAFIDQHVEARWQGTRRGAEKLQFALDDMRVRLEKSEAALQDYARSSGLLLTADRNLVGEDKLRLLQTETSQAQADTALKQSRFDAFKTAADASLPSVVNDPVIQDSQAKLTDLRRQLAELSTTYTVDYSKVRRLRAQIAPLELAIHQALIGAKDRAASEFTEAKQREVLLKSAYQSEVDSLGLQAEKKVHYDALRREVDSTRGLYDTMLARVKEAAIGSTLRASNVRILDAATAPAQPFQPRRTRMALLGSLAGFFLGVGFAAVRQQADPSIQLPGELRKLLNIREFATIPAASASLTAPLHQPTPASAFAEAFQSLRASFLLDSTLAQGKAIVISSAMSAEGKTTVAVHLAIALANIGKRVLLIDGDLRIPRLHSLLGTASDAGLADLLATPSQLSEAQLSQNVRTTTQANLEVLSAGLTNPDSPSSLYSSRLSELFALARKNFDIVLIDSPPMIQIPDARILGRAADAVLLVVQARKTPRELLLAVRQKLAEDNTPMIGCVLNKWNPKQSSPYFQSSRKVASSSNLTPLAKLVPRKSSLSTQRPA